MMTAWVREDQPDVAAERILDAAGRAFVELGVAAVGMGRIAEIAGCSRGTLYRYFKSRRDLHLAYVNREALKIVSRVGARIDALDDPQERLVEGILRSLREVRRTPGTAAWFEASASGMAATISGVSEAIEMISTTFVSELLGLREDDAESRLRARWLVRVIVSFLATPGASAAEERALIERFAAPVLLAASDGRRRSS